ncbi:MAG: hypothetical protein V3U06_05600, partial [Candidatus Binatia bacterium]
MNRERWLLFISILIFASVGVYYLRPDLGLMAKKKIVRLTARKSALKPAFPVRFTDRRFAEVAMKGEVVNEQTPWGRNPFLTEEEVTGKKESRRNEYLQVKSIILGPPQSVATVNGHTVVVGEKIGEETVKEIRPEGVV